MTPPDALAAARPLVPAATPARPASPQEAARAFETLLVRELVRTLTRDLFQTSAAAGGPLAGLQRDLQRDHLTELLTARLVDAGAFRLRDLLLRQWERSQGTPSP